MNKRRFLKLGAYRVSPYLCRDQCKFELIMYKNELRMINDLDKLFKCRSIMQYSSDWYSRTLPQPRLGITPLCCYSFCRYSRNHRKFIAKAEEVFNLRHDDLIKSNYEEYIKNYKKNI